MSDGSKCLLIFKEILNRWPAIRISEIARESDCSTVPVRALTDLTQSLDKALKKLVDNYWPQHAEQLPTGLSAMMIGSAGRR